MIRDHRQARRWATGSAAVVATLPLALGTGLAGAGLGCELPNPDHCINRADDANGWCAARDPAFPICSPCAEFNAGCVAREPTQARCPAYSQPTSTGMDDETGSDDGSF